MAKKTAAIFPLIGETEWLGRVREVRHPLDPSHPLRVTLRRFTKSKAGVKNSDPCPETHPYCEITFALEGRGAQLIGLEKMVRSRGDISLIGPGIPHYGTILEYPAGAIAVHFLPVLLFEMGPGGDGARILARFTGSRPISQRIVRPSPALQKRFAGQFEAMLREFQGGKLGSEMRARLLLMDILIELLRWEESSGKAPPHHSPGSNWGQVEKVLHFIYRHYAEPLYIEQIAREVGMSTNGLHRLFRDAFGMSCIQYLGAYRISHATSLLCLPGARVTEVAPAVGFETLSHFNSAFRRFQGMSPTEYIRSRTK
jgi:AraC-like DNA-binding protein/quercetin dioxygenase-like cupin family protein